MQCPSMKGLGELPAMCDCRHFILMVTRLWRFHNFTAVGFMSVGFFGCDFLMSFYVLLRFGVMMVIRGFLGVFIFIVRLLASISC